MSKKKETEHIIKLYQEMYVSIRQVVNVAGRTKQEVMYLRNNGKISNKVYKKVSKKMDAIVENIRSVDHFQNEFAGWSHGTHKIDHQ